MRKLKEGLNELQILSVYSSGVTDVFLYDKRGDDVRMMVTIAKKEVYRCRHGKNVLNKSVKSSIPVQPER